MRSADGRVELFCKDLGCFFSFRRVVRPCKDEGLVGHGSAPKYIQRRLWTAQESDGPAMTLSVRALKELGQVSSVRLQSRRLACHLRAGSGQALAPPSPSSWPLYVHGRRLAPKGPTREVAATAAAKVWRVSHIDGSKGGRVGLTSCPPPPSAPTVSRPIASL